MIHLLFTGGTISMQRDTAAGGNVPAHGGEALVGFAPDLARVGPYRIEDWARLPACHLDQDRLWALRERVRSVAESGEVRGIVVTHGTDTLEETAYLLGRTLDHAVPVAITGAMRTSSDAGWDGPRNLVDAVTVAAAPESRGAGAHGRVPRPDLRRRDGREDPHHRSDAFCAPHAGPIGGVEAGRVATIGAGVGCTETVARPARRTNRAGADGRR